MDNIFEYSTSISHPQSINISDLKVTRKRKPLFLLMSSLSHCLCRVLMGNQKELSLLFDEPLISVDNVRESTRLNGAL